MSYAEVTAASRRLAMLRFLKEMDGSANESVIATAMRQAGFMGRALGDTREDIRLLEAHDLVKATMFAGTVMVANLTGRGLSYLAREVPPVADIDYPKIGG